MVKPYLDFNSEAREAVRQALSHAAGLHQKRPRFLLGTHLRKLKQQVDQVSKLCSPARLITGPRYDFIIAADKMAGALARLSPADYQKPEKILEVLGPIAGETLRELDRPLPKTNPWRGTAPKTAPGDQAP